MVEIFNPKLSSLISEAEKTTADFKSWKVVRNPYDGDDPNRSTLAKAMVGFANRDGGNLIIGVDDDTREAEGEQLDEERINGILAEIAATECDPNVQWDRTFYSSENDDLEHGDVYVVHIDRRRGPPHAITHEQGKREYRIRSGDETRLVDTGELAWLFRHQSFPKYKEHVKSGLLYHKNLEPLSLDLPMNHNLIQQLLFKLSDGDVEFITAESERMIDFVGVIAPFAFLRSLNIYHMNSWDVELKETK
jgi:predicted HTH transcriptional regulator